jgi:hypothetical protein
MKSYQMTAVTRPWNEGVKTTFLIDGKRVSNARYGAINCAATRKDTFMTTTGKDGAIRQHHFAYFL